MIRHVGGRGRSLIIYIYFIKQIKQRQSWRRDYLFGINRTKELALFTEITRCVSKKDEMICSTNKQLRKLVDVYVMIFIENKEKNSRKKSEKRLAVLQSAYISSLMQHFMGISLSVKPAGNEVLLQLVLCRFRSWFIIQENRVGHEQILYQADQNFRTKKLSYLIFLKVPKKLFVAQKINLEDTLIYGGE